MAKSRRTGNVVVLAVDLISPAQPNQRSRGKKTSHPVPVRTGLAVALCKREAAGWKLKNDALLRRRFDSSARSQSQVSAVVSVTGDQVGS